MNPRANASSLNNFAIFITEERNREKISEVTSPLCNILHRIKNKMVPKPSVKSCNRDKGGLINARVNLFTVVHIRMRQKLFTTIPRKLNYIDMNSTEEIQFQNHPFVVSSSKQFAYLQIKSLHKYHLLFFTLVICTDWYSNNPLLQITCLHKDIFK